MRARRGVPIVAVMRIRSLISALAVGLMLVVGIDYVTYAATGQSLVLGKTNSASSATTIQRTTAGPAVSFKVKSGAPFAVGSSTKVSKLNADKVDGLDSSQLRAKTYVSAFQPDACAGVSNVPGDSWTRITNVGTFTKASAASYVRLELSSTFSFTIGSSTGAVLELRVDDKPTTMGRASLLLRESGDAVPGTIAGVFKGLTSGSHTLSVWTRAVNGTATDVRVDPGCFNSFGANNVLVTQFR
jgi:hypothetical protein